MQDEEDVLWVLPYVGSVFFRVLESVMGWMRCFVTRIVVHLGFRRLIESCNSVQGCFDCYLIPPPPSAQWDTRSILVLCCGVLLFS